MSNTTVSSLATSLPAFQQRMSTIVMPILLIFGSGGNILNALVFLQKTFRSNSCSMYMIAGYLLHTIVLCWAMSTTLYSLNHRDPLTYSEFYCKIRQYLISAIFSMARCCVGMACVDRYAVSSPNAKIRAFGRPQITRYMIASIIFIWLIIPVHLIIVNTIQNGRCLMPGLYPYFFAAYAIIIAAIIPPSMMVTFSILAARNIRQIRQRVQPTYDKNGSTDRNTGARLKQYDYQLLKMLLVDVTIYCISAVPSPIYYIYQAITLKDNKTAEQIAWQNFFSYLAYQFLLYIAASTSLYTNLIVSKAFRDEFRTFLFHQILRRQLRAQHSQSRSTNHQSTLPNPMPLARDDSTIPNHQQRTNLFTVEQ